MKQYDSVVYIGRFQPLHLAHLETISRASRLTDNLIIIVGSSRQPRSYKNPWTFGERNKMINDAIINDPSFDSNCRVSIIPNVDTIYDDESWMVRVMNIVDATKRSDDEKIGIIGNKKDDSCFYLEMFPQWEFISQDFKVLNATDIRKIYFDQKMDVDYLQKVVPETTYDFLSEWRKSEDWKYVEREFDYIQKYKNLYVHLPWKPTFNTADSLVICDGHILLIRRGDFPGKGLLALPGGFLDVDQDKSLMDCALRELDEETNIKVPPTVLRKSIVESKRFDAKNRSLRGRVITDVFKIVLDNEKKLPKIKPGTDANQVIWVPLNSLSPEYFFEDHYEIIHNMVRI